MNDDAFKVVIEAAQKVAEINKPIGSVALENLNTRLYEVIAACIDESECEECECEDCCDCDSETCDECEGEINCVCCETFGDMQEHLDELEEKVDLQAQEIGNLKQIIIGLQFKLEQPIANTNLLVTPARPPVVTVVINQ